MKKLSRAEFEAIKASGDFEQSLKALERFTVKSGGGRPRTSSPEKRRADSMERTRRFREKQKRGGGMSTPRGQQKSNR